MKRRFSLTIILGMLGSCIVLAADDEKKENPEATKLFEAARQARAMWTKFPGFTADLAVTINGIMKKGTVQVDEKGKVTISDLPEEMSAWAKNVLTSTVGHRLSTKEEAKTPCTFADDDANHPLGRLIHVLNDDTGSSFRIRDQQMMMVNRKMGDTRFSITMLENVRNEEGRYLPRTFAVHYWDAKTGDLKKSESHYQSWVRQQGIDLPSLVRVLTADKGVDTREIALSHFKLQ
jgi:hypothetical protein